MWPGVRLIEMRLRLKGLSDAMCKVVSVCCVSAVDSSVNIRHREDGQVQKMIYAPVLIDFNSS